MLGGCFHLVPRSSGACPDANNDLNPGFGQGMYSVEGGMTETGKISFTNQAVFDSVGELKQLSSLME